MYQQRVQKLAYQHNHVRDYWYWRISQDWFRCNYFSLRWDLSSTGNCTLSSWVSPYCVLSPVHKSCGTYHCLPNELRHIMFGMFTPCIISCSLVRWCHVFSDGKYQEHYLFLLWFHGHLFLLWFHGQQVAVRGIVNDHGNNTHTNPELGVVFWGPQIFCL